MSWNIPWSDSLDLASRKALSKIDTELLRIWELSSEDVGDSDARVSTLQNEGTLRKLKDTLWISNTYVHDLLVSCAGKKIEIKNS